MTDFKYRLISYNLNRHTIGKMPADAPKQEWADYHCSFERVETTARGLAANIYRGYSICPLYRHGRRKIENFEAAHYIALDCDHNSVEQLRAIDWVGYWSAFTYATPSSTPDNPRCRVVFIPETPITDADTYRRIYAAIAWRLALAGVEADRACKDPLRLYYGSPRCELWANWSLLFDQVAADFIAEYEAAHPATNEYAPSSPIRAAAANSSLSPRFLEVAAGRLLDHVRQAPDGSKHHTLTKIAYVFGGYVAGGYYDRATVIGWLEDAIRPRAASFEKAKRTIQDCLTAGMGQPLYFDVQERQPQPHRKQPMSAARNQQLMRNTDAKPALFTIK